MKDHTYKDTIITTYNDFIEAFWKLYEKKDINKIKVQEICDLAGYHRSTFYNHFVDVYDVLEQIEDKIINELIEKSDEGLVLLDIEESAKRFANVYTKYKKYLKLLADDKKDSRFALKLSKRLKPAYKKILIFSDNKNESDCVLEYNLNGSIAAIMQYFKGETELSIEEVLNIAIEISKSGKYGMRRI